MSLKVKSVASLDLPWPVYNIGYIETRFQDEGKLADVHWKWPNFKMDGIETNLNGHFKKYAWFWTVFFQRRKPPFIADTDHHILTIIMAPYIEPLFLTLVIL